MSKPEFTARSLLFSGPVATRDGNAWRMNRRAYTLFGYEQGVLSMLVLSRKVGERIHVGDNIVLEIRRIAGNRVTLALDAPRTVRILRGELEGAAREFRTAEHTDDIHPEAQPVLTPPANVTILHDLHAEPVGGHV